MAAKSQAKSKPDSLRGKLLTGRTKVRSGPNDWLDSLIKRDPEGAKELIGLVREWTDGGEIRQVFPSASNFARELVRVIIPEVKVETAARSIRGVEDGTFNIDRF
jgi:hypothetical protein